MNNWVLAAAILALIAALTFMFISEETRRCETTGGIYLNGICVK